jgi:hypothetical protein
MENIQVPPVDASIDAGPSLQLPDLYLEFCSRADPRYQDIRRLHYVKNKGVHAQQLHFMVWFKGAVVGIISGSSAVYATPKRDLFFGITRANRERVLRGIINNIVFRLECSEPNLATRTLALWRKVSSVLWKDIYGVTVYGFETLIIEDRTKILEGGYGSELKDDPVLSGDFKKSPGTLYKADNWTCVGETEGFTKSHKDSGLNESFQVEKVQVKIMWCIWNAGHKQAIESEGDPTWQASKKWNETLERRLKRRYPDMTEEKWVVFSAELKKRAKEMAVRRQFHTGKKFWWFEGALAEGR